MVENNKYDILTSEGFKDFDGIKKSKHKENVKFTFNDDTQITVSRKHLFKVDNSFIEATEFKVSDMIQDKKIISIENNTEYDGYFYDPVEVKSSDSSYIADDIEHHNCLYVDECIKGEETVIIKDKETLEEKEVTLIELEEILKEEECQETE